nr:hypothetical protein [uncultured Marvinbryantia sp.]
MENNSCADNIAGSIADSTAEKRKDKDACRKILRTLILTAGGALIIGLLVPAGILFLGISLVWKITDYLLKKVDRR